MAAPRRPDGTPRRLRSSLVAALLLLEDLVESDSPAAPGRLALFASVILIGAPPGRRLKPRPPAAARRAGRGVGGETSRTVDGGAVRRDAEGAGGTGGAEDGGGASSQLPEAGALLQTSSTQTRGGALQGEESGGEGVGLRAVQAT